MSFGSAAIPPGLPAELTDALIEPAAPGAWRIRCGPSEWVVTARAVHVHEDPASAFNRALPPRRVPLHKRLFWGMVLTLVRSPTGRRLLLRLRG